MVVLQLVLHDSHSVISLNAEGEWGDCNGSAWVPVVLIIGGPAVCHVKLAAV